MDELIVKIIKIGGVNVLPFIVVAYAYWKQTQRFLDFQRERMHDQREILEQNHEVIKSFTKTIDELKREVDDVQQEN